MDDIGPGTAALIHPPLPRTPSTRSKVKILLGISGSIAAYKAALLTRLWVKRGDEVQVLMTDAAADFIAPLTLSTLSKRPVLSSVRSEAGWNNHVELGLWADAYVIAPATANTLAKLANGLCDNLLSAVYLSARCPVYVAPAMDVDMWHHPATQANLQRLQAQGVRIIPVGVGELASGLVGEGRMAEPEEIVAFVAAPEGEDKDRLSTSVGLGGSALITAGPTYEALDPVRFIGNHSTGKMGIAIADALAEAGVAVTLVLGPTPLRPRHAGVRVVPVTSAQQMYEACAAVFPQVDIAVLAAAVADYRPKEVSQTKIKKRDDDMRLDLERTVDIAATLGQHKRPDQVFVGFALETNDEIAHAQGKLARKNFDFIVLNSMQDAGAGFGHDTNKISILRRDGSRQDFPLKSKAEVAQDIVAEIAAHSANRKG
ncbi:MAG TPA: bifunctional phosphopantothenoylcysteine decarboxylase/phosphopantothenate--cysteine ligase CoaBC [Saprospiraceae bacterium]|nr:bifunctional phosphopantothenoylcysteine decarboxylase/phosphopantothenate--cysteine ligase CoaBC [Saprospiraceae bacterium]HNG89792.1 bifunctional phosphopantothenoylcysteine decarboxylase/phosphopantothenate--cysteine ligase CoaBC [Saprospiraceae bacterium]